MKKSTLTKASVLLFTFIVSGVNPAESRVAVITASAGLSNEYSSNVFHTKDDEITEWNTVFAPTLAVTSSDSNDEISLDYSPNYSYNHRRDENEITHHLGLSSSLKMSDRLTVSFSDQYSYYDNLFHEAAPSLSITMQFLRLDSQDQSDVLRYLFPDEYEAWIASDDISLAIPRIEEEYNNADTSTQARVDAILDPSSSGDSRKRYWQNSVTIGTDYEYAEGSTLSFGYSFSNQDNATGKSSDRQIHEPSAAITYRFNEKWLAGADYTYTNSTYDQSDDSRKHAPSLSLEYSPTERDTLIGSYGLSIIDYDATSIDHTDHDLGLVYDRAITEHLNTSVNATGNYLQRVGVSDERGVDLDLSITNSFEKYSMSVSGAMNHTQGNGTGMWSKIRKSWEGQLNFNGHHDFSSYLSSGFDLSYSKNYIWSSGTGTTNDDFNCGLNMTYVINQWFNLTLSYEYQFYDTDAAYIDDYEDHQVTLELSAAKDLWRW